MLTELESEKGPKNSTYQHSPAKKESESNSRLERMGNKNKASHTIRHGNHGKPKMIFPTLHRENFDELEGAAKQENDSDKGRHKGCADQLIS